MRNTLQRQDGQEGYKEELEVEKLSNNHELIKL